MEFLEGTNIQKLSSNFYEEAGIQLGKKLNKIHSIKIVNFNEEIANYTKWSHDKWVERLSYYINSFPNTVKQKIFTIDQINKVENIVNNTILKIKFPSLLHGDIHEDNLLYRLSDGKIKLTGVIDLNTTFGDPMLDLAIIKVHEIDKRKLNDFYKDIFKGYGILTMEETIKMNYLKLLYLYWYIGNRFMNDKPFRSHLNYFNRELNYSYL